jgi:hypothetical protein
MSGPPPVHVTDVIEVFYDGSSGKVERPRHNSTTSCSQSILSWPANHSDLDYVQAKCYFQLIIFTPSIYFVDLLYMPWLLFRSPLDMLGGLVMPTRRSPDLRVQIFYLVLCSSPP